MSAALVVYVQTLRAPVPGMIYGDPGMPAVAPQASIILRDAAKADSLAGYLASVAMVNPTYAALRQAAVAQRDESGNASPLIRANLERARARARQAFPIHRRCRTASGTPRQSKPHRRLLPAPPSTCHRRALVRTE